MAAVTRSSRIPAPAAVLWRILAELDRYEEWESGYVSSAFLGDQRSGVGSMRRVELRSPMGVRWAKHVVTRWEEPSLIAWAAQESNFPFLAEAEQTITLEPAGDATTVENRVEYGLKYGGVGQAVNRLMFRRVVEGAAEGFLDSLASRAAASSGDG